MSVSKAIQAGVKRLSLQVNPGILSLAKKSSVTFRELSCLNQPPSQSAAKTSLLFKEASVSSSLSRSENLPFSVGQQIIRPFSTEVNPGFKWSIDSLKTPPIAGKVAVIHDGHQLQKRLEQYEVLGIPVVKIGHRPQGDPRVVDDIVIDNPNVTELYVDSSAHSKAILEYNEQHPDDPITMVDLVVGNSSENPESVKLFQDAGLTVMSPSPAAMEAGNKDTFKQMLLDSGLPVNPGGYIRVGEQGQGAELDSLKQDMKTELIDRFGEFGKLILKPESGGGGRGMVVIHTLDDIDSAIEFALQGMAATGDQGIIWEKFHQNILHVEFQCLGDRVISARNCSPQRDFRKHLESTLSPRLQKFIDDYQVTQDVESFLSHINYDGPGTFEIGIEIDPDTGEFKPLILVDKEGNSIEKAYFSVEMNVRFQVEKEVTEQEMADPAQPGQPIDLLSQLCNMKTAVANPDTLDRSYHVVQSRIYLDPVQGSAIEDYFFSKDMSYSKILMYQGDHDSRRDLQAGTLYTKVPVNADTPDESWDELWDRHRQAMNALCVEGFRVSVDPTGLNILNDPELMDRLKEDRFTTTHLNHNPELGFYTKPTSDHDVLEAKLVGAANIIVNGPPQTSSYNPNAKPVNPSVFDKLYALKSSLLSKSSLYGSANFIQDNGLPEFAKLLINEFNGVGFELVHTRDEDQSTKGSMPAKDSDETVALAIEKDAEINVVSEGPGGAWQQMIRQVLASENSMSSFPLRTQLSTHLDRGDCVNGLEPIKDPNKRCFVYRELRNELIENGVPVSEDGTLVYMKKVFQSGLSPTEVALGCIESKTHMTCLTSVAYLNSAKMTTSDVETFTENVYLLHLATYVARLLFQDSADSNQAPSVDAVYNVLQPVISQSRQEFSDLFQGREYEFIGRDLDKTTHVKPDALYQKHPSYNCNVTGEKIMTCAQTAQAVADRFSPLFSLSLADFQTLKAGDQTPLNRESTLAPCLHLSHTHDLFVDGKPGTQTKAVQDAIKTFQSLRKDPESNFDHVAMIFSAGSSAVGSHPDLNTLLRHNGQDPMVYLEQASTIKNTIKDAFSMDTGLLSPHDNTPGGAVTHMLGPLNERDLPQDWLHLAHDIGLYICEGEVSVTPQSQFNLLIGATILAAIKSGMPYPDDVISHKTNDSEQSRRELVEELANHALEYMVHNRIAFPSIVLDRLHDWKQVSSFDSKIAQRFRELALEAYDLTNSTQEANIFDAEVALNDLSSKLMRKDLTYRDLAHYSQFPLMASDSGYFNSQRTGLSISGLPDAVLFGSLKPGDEFELDERIISFNHVSRPDEYGDRIVTFSIGGKQRRVKVSDKEAVKDLDSQFLAKLPDLDRNNSLSIPFDFEKFGIQTNLSVTPLVKVGDIVEVDEQGNLRNPIMTISVQKMDLVSTDHKDQDGAPLRPGKYRIVSLLPPSNAYHPKKLAGKEMFRLEPLSDS